MGNACCANAEPNAVEITNVDDAPKPQVVQEPAKEAPKEAPKEEEAAPPPAKIVEEPEEKLEVVFLTAKDGEKTLNFTKRPLGMDYTNKEPVAVTKVVSGGYAQELGVQIGWQIMKIGGKSVSDPEYKDFKVLTAYFNDKAAALPLAK